MKLSDFAVDRPVTTIMLVCLILLIGGVSLSKLPVDLMPDMNLPYAVVVTNYQGASPLEVEKTISKPVEESVATVDNVKDIISISRPGTSMVLTELDWGTDMNFATLEMREQISLVEERLPDEVEKPMVLKFDPTSMPIMQIGISGDGNLETLKTIGTDIYKPNLERIPGVASVNVVGGKEREIQLNINQELMQGYGLSLDTIVSGIKQANMNLSGGSLTYGTKKLLLKTDGEFKNIDEVKNLEVTTPQGQKVALNDLAQIKDTYKDREQYTYLNGKESIGLVIQKQSGTNTVQVANAVKKKLGELRNKVKSDINTKVVMNQAEFIEKAVNNLKRNAIIGAGLAILILLLFLRNIRSTIIIGTTIPISVVTAFILMYFSDLTLNLMTVGGLALGIGMLVDNAIVVLENIYRHRQEGKGMITAAKEGTSEVGTAILASTLTTAAVFLPILYVEGLASQLFGSLALTVSFSLVASLLMALTLIPMLSSKLLKVKENLIGKAQEENFGKITRSYQKILRSALNYKYLILILVIVSIVGVGVGLKTGVIPLESEFLPQTDRGSLNVNIELPPGEALEETDQVVQQVEDYLQDIPEVDIVYTNVGGSQDMIGMDTKSNQAKISVELVDLQARKRSTIEVVELLRKKVSKISGANIKVKPETSFLGGDDSNRAPVEVMIQGPGLNKLNSISNQIKEEMKKVKGTRNVELSVTKNRPEIQIEVKRKIAKELGFSVGGIAQTVKTAIRGQVATKYKEGGEEFDVRVQLTEEENSNLQQLKNLKLTSPAGNTVPLEQVAEVKLTKSSNKIERESQQRIVRVMTELQGRSLSAVQRDIKSRVDQLNIPAEYTIEYGGQVEDMRESFGDLSFALILAVILVYMVMASQFESLIHPFTIMFSVPLALIGALLGLAITGLPLSVPAIIGSIMLAGIVVNNAIVLVDYINTRREKESKEEAILNAGPIRFRPIMMTALTTLLGLFPLALGFGEGSEAQQPMAVVVIGGLLFSTILTLVIVPAIYSIFDDFGQFIKNLFGYSEEEQEIEA